MPDESTIINTEKLLKFSKKVWQFLLFDWNIIERKIWKFKLSQIMNILRYTFFVIIFLNFLLYMLINANYLVELAVTRDFNLAKFTGAFTYVAATSLLLARYSCIFLNKRLIDEILVFLPKEYKKSEVPHDVYSFLMTFFKFAVFLRWFDLLIIPSAIMQVIIRFITTGQKTFPYAIKFPFDAFRIETYLICLLWVLISHTIFALTNLTHDNVTYGLITLVSAEFKLLAAEYRKLGENSNHLISCVKRHVELHEIAEKLQKIFAFSFLTYFLISSILICFTAFICSTAPSPMALIFNAVFCLFTMIKIFTQCFFGQLLKDASASVIDAIYECEWEKSKDMKLKRGIILMIMRSQKSASLSLFGIWDIDLDQFQSVRITWI
jgi:hypothetical protein